MSEAARRQLLHLCEKACQGSGTGVVGLNQGTGEIRFKAGVPLEAVYGELRGEAALERVIRAAIAGGGVYWQQADPLDPDSASLHLSPPTILERIRRAPAETPEEPPALDPTAGADRPSTPSANGTAGAASVNAAEKESSDDLPRFLPLPLLAPSSRSGSFLRLLPGLDSALLELNGDSWRALVVVVDRELVEGYAEVAGEVLMGADVLDELSVRGLLAGPRAQVWDLPTALLRSLSAYWQAETNFSVAGGAWLEPSALIDALRRSGQRGVVVVVTPEESGLAFLEGSELIGAYRTGAAEAGTLEMLEPLFRHPEARILGRLQRVSLPAPNSPAQQLPAGPAADAEQLSPGDGSGSPSPEPAHPPLAAPAMRDPSAGAVVGGGPKRWPEPDIDPMASPSEAELRHRGPATTMPGPSAAEPVGPSGAVLRQRLVEAARSDLHEHVELVEKALSGHPPTREGLLAAAVDVEELRPRLINPERMSRVATLMREVIRSS